MPVRGKLRKREVVLAVAAGALAAGGAALIIDSGENPAPIVAAGGPDNLTYEVAPFTRISTVGPQDVIVTYGETISVRSQGSPEALARLEAVVEDGRLTIQPKGGFRGGVNWGRLSSATFHVTLPRLEAFSLAGSGEVRVDRVEGESFEASIAGPGELAIEALQVNRAEFSIAGPGNVAAAGNVREARVSIAGSGDVRAAGLRSETAEVSIAGSGDTALTVEREARVSIMGSGDVDIEGPARCTVSRMGNGDVRCGQTVTR